MKGVLYMVVKKKEFYCNLGVQTGYAEIKPVLKAVRMPDGTVSSFCQFTLAIPGERTSYTIFCVEELAQQCAESVTPGDLSLIHILRNYQPEACICVCGPDIRWCGNEAGDVRDVYKRQEWHWTEEGTREPAGAWHGRRVYGRGSEMESVR